MGDEKPTSLAPDANPEAEGAELQERSERGCGRCGVGKRSQKKATCCCGRSEEVGCDVSLTSHPMVVTALPVVMLSLRFSLRLGKAAYYPLDFPKGAALADIRKPRNIPSSLHAHVVFIHGVNGHNERSWLSSGKPKEFWPDWLNEDVPNVAIWSVGFPAEATRWQFKGGAMALPDRAANVLDSILSEPGLAGAPIIFVGYSLGGLVIKETMRAADTASKTNARAATFLSQVRRIVFLGTPHSGSDTASIVNVLSRVIRPRESVRGLSRNDPHLRDLNVWFRAHFETEKLEGIVLREDKPMGLFFIVKPDSADPGLPSSVPVVPVDEDHSTIRFPRDRSAHVYRTIKAFVAQPFPVVAPRNSANDGVLSVRTSIEDVRADLQNVADDTRTIRAMANLAASAQENPLVTAEAERRLWRLRKIRFTGAFEAKNETDELLRDVRNGDLVSASKDIKRRALAWCSRIVATFDTKAAQSLLDEADQLGAGEENAFARAFILGFEGNVPGALESISKYTSPAARTVAFLIATRNLTPAESLAWLSAAGLAFKDLDPDGKLQVIQRRIVSDDWGRGFDRLQRFGRPGFRTHTTAVAYVRDGKPSAGCSVATKERN